jgi:hypothetical protein
VVNLIKLGKAKGWAMGGIGWRDLENRRNTCVLCDLTYGGFCDIMGEKEVVMLETTRKPWTKPEEDFLRESYPIMPYRELQKIFLKKFPKRTTKSINRKIEKMGLHREKFTHYGAMYRNEQLRDLILKNIGSMNQREISEAFGCSANVVGNCAKYYGIKWPTYTKQTQTDKNLKAKQTQLRRKKAYNEYKKDGCIVCGFKTPCALDWHHLNPDEKEFEVSLKFRMTDNQIFENELEKCVLLCSNHHRMLHNGLLNLDKYLLLDKNS